ncbi:hypothetical protein Peur_040001 [Populus x canadensis]
MNTDCFRHFVKQILSIHQTILGKLSKSGLNNGDGDNFKLHNKLKASVELNQLMGDSVHVGTLQADEGNVAAEERTNEASKMSGNNNGFLEDEVRESMPA